MHKNIERGCIIAILSTFILTGCSTNGADMLFENQTTVASDYYADYSLSASEYAMFLNREIANVKNELLTFIVFCKGTSTDASLSRNNVDTVKQNLSESYNKIKMTKPPENRETDRTKILEIFTNVSNDMDTAINILNGNTDQSGLDTILSDIEAYNVSLSLYTTN